MLTIVTGMRRRAHFFLEMASLLRKYCSFCQGELEVQEDRELPPEDYIFRRHGADFHMAPITFTWRFKLILKKHNLLLDLNVHSLRYTSTSLMISGGADVANRVRTAGVLTGVHFPFGEVRRFAWQNRSLRLRALLREAGTRQSPAFLAPPVGNSGCAADPAADLFPGDFYGRMYPVGCGISSGRWKQAEGNFPQGETPVKMRFNYERQYDYY